MNTQHRSRSECFIDENGERWRDLENLVGILGKKGPGALSREQLRRFPALLRSTAADLSYAKSASFAPDVVAYLNDLTGRASFYIYNLRRVPGGYLKNLLLNTLPRILYRQRKYLYLSLLLFFGSLLISFALVYANPDRASAILDPVSLSKIAGSFSSDLTVSRSAGGMASMTAFYINNNISISFICFSLGVTLGIGTLLVLVYNGLMIGTIAAYVIAIGNGERFLNFIAAHSVPELFAVCLAGAGGFFLGNILLRASGEGRRRALKRHRGQIMIFVVAMVILLFLAALVEGFVSPNFIPLPLKLIFPAVFSTGLILLFRRGKKQEAECR